MLNRRHYLIKPLWCLNMVISCMFYFDSIHQYDNFSFFRCCLGDGFWAIFSQRMAVLLILISTYLYNVFDFRSTCLCAKNRFQMTPNKPLKNRNGLSDNCILSFRFTSWQTGLILDINTNFWNLETGLFWEVSAATALSMQNAQFLLWKSRFESLSYKPHMLFKRPIIYICLWLIIALSNSFIDLPLILYRMLLWIIAYSTTHIRSDFKFCQ